MNGVPLVHKRSLLGLDTRSLYSAESIAPGAVLLAIVVMTILSVIF